ncbi:hypothetical protein BN3659_01387 [Alistipes sp. CHKCI003]|nr:hypothetical protein BN3659_01387 [Alistipes sp. CHKCI003]
MQKYEYLPKNQTFLIIRPIFRTARTSVRGRKHSAQYAAPPPAVAARSGCRAPCDTGFAQGAADFAGSERRTEIMGLSNKFFQPSENCLFGKVPDEQYE